MHVWELETECGTTTPTRPGQDYRLLEVKLNYITRSVSQQTFKTSKERDKSAEQQPEQAVKKCLLTKQIKCLTMSTLPRPVSVTDVTATMSDWRDPPSARCCRREIQDSGFSFSTDLSLPPTLSPDCLQGNANFLVLPLFSAPHDKYSRSWGQSDWSHWWTDGDRVSKGMERPPGLREDLVPKALLWTISHSCCGNDCKSARALSSAFIPDADIP